MTNQKIKDILQQPEYDFLKKNSHLGDNIMLLTLGGSHAYGTNVESSDLDIRGCARNTPREILCGLDFEQVVERQTDTTIYSFQKLVNLLKNCNPNMIELLGNKKEDYLYISPLGQQLLDNKQIFLSKKAAFSFGGYATAQLRRLDNKAMRNTSQAEREKHILGSMRNATVNFKELYATHEEDAIKLYVDDSQKEELEKEIFVDLQLLHYPLRDLNGMLSEFTNVLRTYTKYGTRNEKAASHNKLGKHMMHLIRLDYMCLDILEKGEILTYREKEHELLMSIRNGDFLDTNNQPTAEFFKMVEELNRRIEVATSCSKLPDVPDLERIHDFVMDINQQIVVQDAH